MEETSTICAADGVGGAVIKDEGVTRVIDDMTTIQENAAVYDHIMIRIGGLQLRDGAAIRDAEPDISGHHVADAIMPIAR